MPVGSTRKIGERVYYFIHLAVGSGYVEMARDCQVSAPSAGAACDIYRPSFDFP